MKNKHEHKYFVAIAVIIPIYLFVVYNNWGSMKELSTMLTTTTALIAAVTFWMQLKRTENLNEANFIMNLNNQFISNKEMTSVEHALELFYNQECEAEGTGVLTLNLDRADGDCQSLINYLVYMEGLAALVQRNVLHLGVIDDLFAYRFFIAVNNPVVQEQELLPYANYYQGCFKLCEMWTKEWNGAKRPIPLSKYSLCDCDKSKMNVPYKES